MLITVKNSNSASVVWFIHLNYVKCKLAARTKVTRKKA